jgi:toxin ParE1/3/4
MIRVVYTPRFQRELRRIVGTIASDNVSAADAFVEQLERYCALLATTPAMGPLRPEVGRNVRYLGMGNYLVFYRWSPKQEQVVILSVWHGRRRLPHLQG